MSLLQSINSPVDLRQLPLSKLPYLCTEMREAIIDLVSTKAGHLGASLGVIELTVALHYVFDTPDDSLIWDVGHQAYGHKLLTGRREQFHTNRQKDGLSGFPKPSESIYDGFGVGHSSTSISAAIGRAIAAKLKGENSRKFVSIIGDASIVSGMAMEALNHLGETDTNVLIVLNDNSIGIDFSVGCMRYLWENESLFSSYLSTLKINYLGSVDGHNLSELIEVFKNSKSYQKPALVRVKTIKGKGFAQAEEDQVRYHAPGIFNKKTGQISPEKELRYQDVFGQTLIELFQKNQKLFAITPAMPTGSGLIDLIKQFPERAIDVGIAEQHAVTLSAGLAMEGYKTYCCIYSTFLQRAYDQLIHDVALQNLPVVFCIDRAGLVGEDGATHQGVFDIGFLQIIPNLTIWSPKNATQLKNALYHSQFFEEGPLVIRYPRGYCQNFTNHSIDTSKEINPFETITTKGSVAVISVGTIFDEVDKAIAELKEPIAHFHLFQIKPLPIKNIEEKLKGYKTIIVVEEGSKKGGVGMHLKAELNLCERINLMGIPDTFIEHATYQEQLTICELDSTYIKKEIKKYL